MKKLTLIILITGCLLFFNSCSRVGGPENNDDQIDHSDNIFPVLTVNKPVNNQVYNNGDTIFVQGEATDEKLMYRGRIRITDDSNGFVMKEESYETHVSHMIGFNFFYKTAVAVLTNYTISVEFEDHGLNRVSVTYKVKVNP